MHSWTRQMVILTEVEVVQMTDVTVHVHISNFLVKRVGK